MSSDRRTPTLLPDLRRVVTAHNDAGISIVQSDSTRPSIESPAFPDSGIRASTIWVTTDSIPTKDCNNSEDGGEREIHDTKNFGIVHPNGTNLRSTELAPGASSPMHRTTSLDYNILVHGELISITEDGTEKHLKNPGDVIIHRGTMHAWKNPGPGWARWVTVLMAAEPAVVAGKTLESDTL